MKNSNENRLAPDNKDPKIVLLGIGGGIAAYKAIQIASKLFQSGLETHVAMTEAAQKFINPLTFSAVTNRKVISKIFSPTSASDKLEEIYPHLYPATYTDIFVLAPATADLIAKIAYGFGDGIVSTCVLSLPENCKRFFCPSMNVEMWNQKIVQQNVAKIEADGWVRIGPDKGHLACGAIGAGRMAEPELILEKIWNEGQEEILASKQVLILSGPTIEPIDPVRFISNASSGKMGKALALAAAAQGANVDFVSGPVPQENLPFHPKINIVKISNAAEMLKAAQTHFSKADIAIFAAAVADFTPKDPNNTKSPKPSADFKLELTKTKDIAATLGKSKKQNQLCIGFALESAQEAIALQHAQEKIQRKDLDGIVLNYPDSFNSDSGNFTFLSQADGVQMKKWGKINKETCANKIMDEIINMGRYS